MLRDGSSPGFTRRFSRLFLVFAFVGIATSPLTGSAAAVVDTSHSIGGTPELPTTAPWSVLIEIAGALPCTGSIVGASTVLTAASCVVNANGAPYPAAGIEIYAGVSSYPSSVAQAVTVTSVAVDPAHLDPYYDLALLTTTNPLTATPSVSPIAMGSRLQSEDAGQVTVFGFGRPSANDAGQPALRSLGMTAYLPFQCTTDSPAELCLASKAGGLCSGDDGAGVVMGSPATLIGVVNSYEGDTLDCLPGEYYTAADITSPVNADWISGAPPPAVPLPEADSGTLGGSTVPGGLLNCSNIVWRNATTVRYLFFRSNGGPVLQAESKKKTYRTSASETGWRIFCASDATNAAGLSEAAEETEVPIGSRIAAVVGFYVEPSGKITYQFSTHELVRLRLTVSSSNGKTLLKREDFTSKRLITRLPKVKGGHVLVCVSSAATKSFSVYKYCQTLINPE